MKLAILEAKKAIKKDEVPVGAVIVKDNKVIVEVKHPAFLAELRRQGNDKALLQKIAAACPELEINEIVFVPAGQYRPENE